MEEEFCVCRNKRRKPEIKSYYGSEFVVNYVVTDKNDLLRKISESKSVVDGSQYISNLINKLKDLDIKFDSILCYGLGSISDSSLSRHQVSALLALKEHFLCPACVYDPVFNPIEIETLEDLGLSVPKANDEGKKQLSDSEKTLVYLPHCSSQLTNNFLWANWNSTLHNCVILSNSFSTVINRNNSATVSSLSCLRDIIEVTDECMIKDTYEVSDVFNDLSIHIFPQNKVNNSEFWAKRLEPNYKGQTIEFCPKETVIKVQLLDGSNQINCIKKSSGRAKKK